jgi:hypothetical protein
MGSVHDSHPLSSYVDRDLVAYESESELKPLMTTLVLGPPGVQLRVADPTDSLLGAAPWKKERRGFVMIPHPAGASHTSENTGDPFPPCTREKRLPSLCTSSRKGGRYSAAIHQDDLAGSRSGAAETGQADRVGRRYDIHIPPIAGT